MQPEERIVFLPDRVGINCRSKVNGTANSREELGNSVRLEAGQKDGLLIDLRGVVADISSLATRRERQIRSNDT